MIYIIIFASFIHCEHIPYVLTQTSFLPSVGGNFDNIISENDKVIVLVTSNKITDKEYVDIQIMSEISVEFTEDVFFGIMYEEEAGRVLSKGNFSLPCVAYFERKELVTVFEVPYHHLNTAFVLRNLIYGPRKAESFDELKEYFSDTELTILTREEDYAECFELMKSNEYGIPSFEIVKISKELFDELELNGHKFGIFRSFDSFVEPFDDLESLKVVLIPKFSDLKPKDIAESNATFAVILDYDCLTEYKQILINYSLEYPEFRFGFPTSEIFQYYTFSTKKELNLPTYWIFNYREGYSYELPENATFGEYLSMVRDGKIQKMYISEDIPENNDEQIYQLVGKTYADFINNNENVLILYSDPSRVPDKIEEYKELASLLKDSNINFTYININSNSSPKGFPELTLLPDIHLFTKDNKEGIYMPSRFSINNILRFLIQTLGISYTEPEYTYDEALEDLNYLNEQFFAFPAQYRDAVGERMDHLLSLVNHLEQEKVLESL